MIEVRPHTEEIEIGFELEDESAIREANRINSLTPEEFEREALRDLKGE